MSLDNETDTYEFHEMVDRGQCLFNSLLAQYGKAIHREEQEKNTNELLIKAYREYKEYFKDNSRNLIKLGSIEEIYEVIKTHSVIYKSNLEKDENHKALAILVDNSKSSNGTILK